MKKVILSIVILLTVIFIITMGIFSFLNKPKVLETKTFSEIPGFSFEYLVFNGREVEKVKKINENEYSIKLENPTNKDFVTSSSDFYEENQIIIKKEIRADHIDPEVTPQNSKGVFYSIHEIEIKPSKKVKIITFNEDNLAVDITPLLHEGDGYSGKILTDKIIETFMFTDAVSEPVELVRLKRFMNARGYEYKQLQTETTNKPKNVKNIWAYEVKCSGSPMQMIMFQFNQQVEAENAYDVFKKDTVKTDSFNEMTVSGPCLLKLTGLKSDYSEQTTDAIVSAFSGEE